MRDVTARLSNPDHPNGQMIAAGVTWTRTFQTVALSNEKAADVESNPLLEIGTSNVNEDAETDAPDAEPAEAEGLGAAISKALGKK